MLPEFGVVDITFLEKPINYEAIIEQIGQWEPRAIVAIESEPATDDELAEAVIVTISLIEENY